MGSHHLPKLSVFRAPSDLRSFQTFTSCRCLSLGYCMAVAGLSPLLEKQDPRTLDHRGILGKAISLSELPLSPVVGALQSQALTPQPCSVTQPSPVRVMRTFPSYATNAVCLERIRIGRKQSL